MEHNNIQYLPTLTPTFEQWKSLPTYLTHHETSLQRRFGAVKIIPPSRWIPLLKNPYDLCQIKIYNKQETVRTTHQPDVFYIRNIETTKRRMTTYEKFKTIAESDTYRLNDEINNRIMEHFWSCISDHTSLNISNIDDSLFSKRENVFNMTNLPSLLKYYPQPIPGVTSPFLHMGMWSTAVGIHIDEYDLISLNYLHFGAPKIWYIIHPSSYTKLEELVNRLKLFSDTSSSCLSPLQHKSLLIKPSFLQAHSIEYSLIEQKMNELVVIFPGTYHFSVDTGFNLSETSKYALPSWLQFQRRSPRLCSCQSSSTYRIHLNRRFFTNDILKQFQDEHFTTASPTCIDLSADEDSIADEIIAITNERSEMEQETNEIEISLAQYIDPLYVSSSSSINSNTPSSTSLPSTRAHQHLEEDLWNIFEQVPPQTTSSVIQSIHHSRRYHSYSRLTPWHRPPIYSYPSVRRCNNPKRLKRRQCYTCRRQGHLMHECPYSSRE